MVSILPGQSKWDLLGQAVGQNLSNTLPGAVQQSYQQAQQQKLRQQQQSAIAQRYGNEIASLPIELQKIVINRMMEAENQPGKYQAQYEAKSKAQLDLLRQLGLGDLVGNQNPPQENLNPNQFQPNENSKQQNQPQQRQKIPEQQIMAASLVNPALADKMQKHNDNIDAQQRHDEEMELKKLKVSPEYEREKHVESSQAQADVKYNKDLQEASKQHALKEKSISNLRKLNNQGVTGKPYEKMLERIGLVNLTSEGRREFAADVKNLITDIRSILGGQFSNFEFQTILNAYPSADFSKEANNAILDNLEYFQDIKSKEVKFADELKKENGGKIPYDFQSKVNEKVRNYAASKLEKIKENTKKIINEQHGVPHDHFLMFDPQGNELHVPASEVEKYRQLGATSL